MNPFTESTVATSNPDGFHSAAALVRAGVLALTALSLPGVSFATDINQASLEQLRNVRGIGPKTAQIIIDERTRGGQYESFTDLSDRVKGIGSKKAEALKHAGLTVGTAVSSSPNTIKSNAKAPAK